MRRGQNKDQPSIDKMTIESDPKKSSNLLTSENSSHSQYEAIELNFIRHKLEKFQTTITKDVEKRIAIMVDEVMQELRQHELQIQEFQSFANNPEIRQRRNNQTSTWNNRTLNESLQKTNRKNREKSEEQNEKSDDEKKKNKPHRKEVTKRLPDKIFLTRESYLTALLKVDHMRSIYHIFHTIFLVLCLHTIVHDYFVDGRVNFGLRTFKAGFNRIHYVLGIWVTQHCFVFLLYFAFQTWVYVRFKLPEQSSLQRFWSHSCLITYIASQLIFGYVASSLCLKLDLPFVSASVLLLETSRLLMKMHAFVRSNAARVIAGKLKTNGDSDNIKIPMAGFSWYLYFLFAPTLVYRDSYPRTSHIRWKFALGRFMEGIAVAFLFSYLHERHMVVHFGDYGRTPTTNAELIVKLFGMCMPSIIIFLCGFYLILHAWLNFTAELLRFGDRMFYKDWWTASNYEGYYRKWNVVVHDWLYEYIYKDTYNYIFRGSKAASSLMVFLCSALVHEHILGFAMQLFFPVIFVFFGFIGVVFIFLTRRAPKNIGNLFLWFSLVTGNSLMISLYYMEYFARKNCSLVNEHWSDYVIPAIRKCRV